MPSLLLSLLLFSVVYFALSLQPMNKLVSIVTLSLVIGFLFKQFDLTFKGLAYKIIYIGAITILFLFVKMLVPQDVSNNNLHALKDVLILLGIGLVLSYVVHVSIQGTLWPTLHTDLWDTYFFTLHDISYMAYALFVPYAFCIKVLALLLFIVLIGILALSIS